MSLSKINGVNLSGGLDSYTKLLLHFNGSDGATSTVDSSDSNHTVTFNGNAQLDTAQKKFGTASVYFDGTGDYLEMPVYDEMKMGTGDFTVDFWVRFNSLPTYSRLVTSTNDKVNDSTLLIRTAGSATQTFFGGTIADGTTTLETGRWYHFAYVREGSTCTVYVDGRVDVSVTNSNDLSNAIRWIGGYYSVGPREFSNGWMDNLRISKGIARWTSEFTPQSTEYTANNINKINNVVTSNFSKINGITV